MWDLIVSVPDHCLSFYFVSKYCHTVKQIQIKLILTIVVAYVVLAQFLWKSFFHKLSESNGP